MISSFQGKYGFLSNFYRIDITINDKVWPTSEAMYMAHKTRDKDDQELIRLTTTGSQAKRIGRRIVLRDDWNGMRLEVMRKCLRLKFSLNQECKERLLATGWEDIMEGNSWHDNYWGNCRCVKCKHVPGLNNLGKLLMQTRWEIAQ